MSRFSVLCFAVLTLLGACTTTPEVPAPPPVPPTIAQLAIATDKTMNPDEKGEGTPVVVRVFRLADPAAFQSAKYGDLFETDEKTLGTDLIGTVDILIEPGMDETFNRVLSDRDRYLGFVVTYRDSDTAQWRALVPITPRETTKVEVAVGPRGVIASLVGS